MTLYQQVTDDTLIVGVLTTFGLMMLYQPHSDNEFFINTHTAVVVIITERQGVLLNRLLASERSERDTYRGNTIENRGCLLASERSERATLRCSLWKS